MQFFAIPYNTCLIGEFADLKYDRLHLKDMNSFLYVMSVFMELAAHERIFCLAL